MVMTFLFVGWLTTGGPSRYESLNGAFLRPPAPLGTGETYGELPGIDVSDIKLKLPGTLNVFLAQNNVVIGTRSNRGTTDPSKEYIEIVGRGTSPTLITGWRLSGKNGVNTVIPRGTRTLFTGRVNETSDITLPYGGRAVLVSGTSPVGTSFRINKCSGYLGAFQEFTPSISRIACPSPVSEAASQGISSDQNCVSYASSIPVCSIVSETLPSNFSSTCRDFLLNRLTYNGCVSAHQADADFYTNEWRVYLGSQSDLWQSSDVIKVYDQTGKEVGAYAY